MDTRNLRSAVRVRTLAVLVLLTLVPACRTQRQVDAVLPESRPITVMTYNILGGRNTDGARDATRIARVINAIGPDLVALQEVDRGTDRLSGRDLPAELAELTGMHVAFGPAMAYDGGEYGVAILSRLPFAKSESHSLPHRDGSEPRAALVAFPATQDSTERFFFISTHLDHQRDPSDRIIQVAQLRRVLKRYLPSPGILAGDLNARPGSRELSDLERDWDDARSTDTMGMSFPSAKPDRRIDFILVAPSSRWKVIRSFTGAEYRPEDAEWQDLLRRSSDHLPVVAVLELED